MEMLVCVHVERRVIFSCPEGAVDETAIIDELDRKKFFKDDVILVTLRFNDRIERARCLMVADEQSANTFIQSFLGRRPDYTLVSSPFSQSDSSSNSTYSSSANSPTNDDTVLGLRSELLALIDALRARIGVLEKEVKTMKSEPFKNPATFADLKIEQKEVVYVKEDKSEALTSYMASKTVYLEKGAGGIQIDFCIPTSSISVEISTGNLSKAVNICRNALYEQHGYELLTYQSAPKDKNDLLYFRLDKKAGQLCTKRFELIIEMCIHLINRHIIDSGCPTNTLDCFITAKNVDALKHNLLTNLGSWRNSTRKDLLTNKRIKTIAQRLEDENTANVHRHEQTDHQEPSVEQSAADFDMHTDLFSDIDFQMDV